MDSSTCPDSRLRIAQLNLQGSQLATRETMVTAKEYGVDVLLAQEHFSTGDPHLLEVEHGAKACVIIFRHDITATFLHHLSNTHCVVVHLIYNRMELYVVSSYFQYSEPGEGHIA